MIQDNILLAWAFFVLLFSLYLGALYATGGTLTGAWLP
jgi:hypothetical protein